MAVGCYQLYRAIKGPSKRKSRSGYDDGCDCAQRLSNFIKYQIEFFGLAFMLKTPDVADLDGSGTISANESIILGTALALDSLRPEWRQL